MSYSVIDTCWNCVKKEKCTDHIHIRDAVNKIHEECISKQAISAGASRIGGFLGKVAGRLAPV